jgi:hypothetical protein
METIYQRNLMNKYIIGIIVAFALAMGFNYAMDTAYGCDKRCMYVALKKEQRKSQRLRSALLVHRKTSELGVRPWMNLAMCESGGRWHLTTGAYQGGLQFSPSTWKAYGGLTFSRAAHGATPIQQIAIAQKVLSNQGRSAWPHCTKIGAW